VEKHGTNTAAAMKPDGGILVVAVSAIKPFYPVDQFSWTIDFIWKVAVLEIGV
jgi:hypothetical protein